MPRQDRSAHVRLNRAAWDAAADDYQQTHQPQLSDAPMKWGVWGLPETELGVLGDLAGRDTLELGCGAAQWSIELTKNGARAVAMDLSQEQLRHARHFVAAAGIDMPLVVADAERLPFADASFDLVFCDYGGMTFADPFRTVPEVARVLRSGGRFAFMTTSPMFVMCTPDGAEHPAPTLTSDYFGMHELRYVEDDGPETIEFQLPHGEWIALFHRHGLTVERLIETRPDLDARSTYRTAEDLSWARRWPMENLWVLTRD